MQLAELLIMDNLLMVDKGSLNSKNIKNNPFNVLNLVLHLNIVVVISLYFFF